MLDVLIDRASLCLQLMKQPKLLSITVQGKKLQSSHVDLSYDYDRFGHPAVVKFLLGAAPQTIGKTFSRNILFTFPMLSYFFSVDIMDNEKGHTALHKAAAYK